MRLLPALLLLVASCAASSIAPELQPFERAAGAAALRAWADSGLPYPDRGHCDASMFRVVLDDSDGFSRSCDALADRAMSCQTWGDTSGWFFYREYPVIHISPNWKSEPGVLIHELLHAYASCARIVALGDPDHRDPRIWQAAGGATSVQARALAILAGTP